MSEERAPYSTDSGTSDKAGEIARLDALANDKQHIRKQALRLAGIYLRGVGETIIESEMGKLDEDIIEDEELSAAHENLLERITDDIERIGKTLEQLAKAGKDITSA